MKRGILFPFILLLLGGVPACRPEKVKGPLLTGKMVINRPCGHYVIQVLSGDYDRGRVAASWKDTLADSIYTNVFTVANVCHFDGGGLAVNDTFSFRMNDTVIVNNCMVCMIFYPTPSVTNTVDHVQRVH
jgi:hypothetical protein